MVASLSLYLINPQTSALLTAPWFYIVPDRLWELLTNVTVLNTIIFKTAIIVVWQTALLCRMQPLFTKMEHVDVCLSSISITNFIDAKCLVSPYIHARVESYLTKSVHASVRIPLYSGLNNSIVRWLTVAWYPIQQDHSMFRLLIATVLVHNSISKINQVFATSTAQLYNLRVPYNGIGTIVVVSLN